MASAVAASAGFSLLALSSAAAAHTHEDAPSHGEPGPLAATEGPRFAATEGPALATTEEPELAPSEGPQLAATEDPEVDMTAGEGAEASTEDSPGVGPPAIRDTRLRLTLERVSMPAEDEAGMGLFGLNFDWHPGPYGYVGVGGYGAATGERGGFFTGGFQGGAKVPIAGPVRAQAGLFLGAGGGGAAPQGGGLMVRPHAGLEVDLEGHAGPISAAGLELAHVEFPNGGIRSTHVALGVEAPWPVAIASGPPRAQESGVLGARSTVGGGAGATNGGDVAAGPSAEGAGGGDGELGSLRTMRFSNHTYLTLPGSEETGGEPLETAIGAVGFEYRAHFSPQIFGVAEARGAAFGGTDGFAEITLGGGYAVPLDERGYLSAFASGGIGGAGGGSVETGGGLLVRGNAGLDANIPGPIHLGLDLGLLEAPTGSFRAFSTGFRLGIATRALSAPGRTDEADLGGGALSHLGWRVRAGHSSYLNARQKSGEEPRIDLLTLKFDHLFGDNLYATGQAAGAYAGASGGFASGLVGAGAQTESWRGTRVFGEALVGVAGGGGIDVGEGLILQPMAGLSSEITEALGLELAGGLLVAPAGATRSPVVELGLSYAFSTAQVEAR